MSQDEDQALDAAWRRASAADAGRPSAGTRAAILAEAAAAARRRQPAANESRYWLSAVAGVAVIGVGVLVWRQADVRMPGETPQVMLETAVEKDVEFAQAAESAAPELDAGSPAPPAATTGSRELARGRTTAPAPVPAAPPVQTLQLERAQDVSTARGNVANAESLRDSAAGGAGAAEGAVTQSAPPAPAPPSAVPEARSPAAADERDELNEVQITGTRIIRSDPRTVGPRPGTVAPVRPPPPPSEAMQLLRSQFPALLNSDEVHRPWVVLDAAGNVVLAGELESGERLEELTPHIERDLGRPPGRWRVENVTNTRGRVITLAIARLP